MPATDLQELFSNLEITESAEPLPATHRGGKELPNPFTEVLRQSVEKSSPYSTYVPADAVNRAVFLINAAARKENLGVRIVVNVQRDDKGSVVKDNKGKAQPIVETRGPNKGKVLIRFQGKAERKTAKAPRVWSIINDPENKGRKALRHRESGRIVARGTHDEMRAELKRRKAQPQTEAQPQQTEAQPAA